MSPRPSLVLPKLGEGFFDVVTPARFPTAILRYRNDDLASRLGLGALDEAGFTRHFARFEPLPDNLPHPLAMRYHGHQFGVYNPMLGDGRGFVLAELEEQDPAAPGRARIIDLTTKGSGRTPWSRGGDGRLTLKGGVREVLATEMLEALGVPTSRSLSLFETGEELWRGDEPSPARSSVLVRAMHGCIRIGTFQRHAFEKDEAKLRALLDLAMAHWVPEAADDRRPAPLAFLAAVARRTAVTCARLMAAGFVHGVLNTDNMNVTGESFDYGPYRFLPTYDPSFVAAYFDHGGLYAFGRQPRAFVWGLGRLADALRPLAPDAAFAEALREFEPAFHEALGVAVCERLGLVPGDPDLSAALVEATYDFLHASQVGYAQFFFDAFGGRRARFLRSPEAPRYAGERFEALLRVLEAFEPDRPERLDDPHFARERPEDLLWDEIEAIWAPIAERDDWSLFNAKVAAIRSMRAAYGRESSTHDASGAPARSS